MRTLIPVENATGEEIEVGSETVEHVTGIELSCIDWRIQQGGKFENGDWEVCCHPYLVTRW